MFGHSSKSEAMEQVLAALTGSDRRETIAAGKCRPSPTGCGKKISTDDHSGWSEIERREFTISGLCASCQRVVFTED